MTGTVLYFYIQLVQQILTRILQDGSQNVNFIKFVVIMASSVPIFSMIKHKPLWCPNLEQGFKKISG